MPLPNQTQGGAGRDQLYPGQHYSSPKENVRSLDNRCEQCQVSLSVSSEVPFLEYLVTLKETLCTKEFYITDFSFNLKKRSATGKCTRSCPVDKMKHYGPRLQVGQLIVPCVNPWLCMGQKRLVLFNTSDSYWSSITQHMFNFSRSNLIFGGGHAVYFITQILVHEPPKSTG